jgi:NAD(P)H-dependent FMN reductase
VEVYQHLKKTQLYAGLIMGLQIIKNSKQYTFVKIGDLSSWKGGKALLNRGLLNFRSVRPQQRSCSQIKLVKLSRKRTEMIARKKILAICGSTRQNSANMNLIDAIGKMFSADLAIKTFDGLSRIPHFNPDLDNDIVSQEVTSFRNQLKDVDGVLICTPEYAMGVPGTLKNAIDWTVSSMDFSHKPVVLITASTLGHTGHQSLMETLKIIEADIADSSQLVIPHIKTKLTGDVIIDPETEKRVKEVIYSFIRAIEKRMTN